MESTLALFIGGVIVVAALIMGGVFNLRRHDVNAMKTIDSMTVTGTRVWSYLTPAQQDELKNIAILIEQEEWITEHVESSVLDGVSAERVLVEFANRGFIMLGKGMFLRHASPLDFVKPEITVATEPKEATPELKEKSENISEDSEQMEIVEEQKDETKLPLILLSSDDCKQCEHVSAELSSKPAPSVRMTNDDQMN